MRRCSQATPQNPNLSLLQIAALLAEVLNLTTNEVAVNGHVRTYPITLIDNPVWDLSSAARADDAPGAARRGAGLARMQRVAGFADRAPQPPTRPPRATTGWR